MRVDHQRLHGWVSHPSADLSAVAGEVVNKFKVLCRELCV